MTVLIIAAGTLTAVVFKVMMMDHDMAPPAAPTASTSSNIQHTETYYQERYESFYQVLMNTFGDDEPSLSILFATPDIPQYQALDWLVYTDTTIVSHATDTAAVTSTPILLQRYIIMVLYYSCGGEAWQMDIPIAGSSGNDRLTTIERLGHIETCEWGRTLSDRSFIVCDTVTKEIVALQLDQKRLIGQLPKELFALSSLVSLDLSYNFLKGTVPSNMFRQMIKLGTIA